MTRSEADDLLLFWDDVWVWRMMFFMFVGCWDQDVGVMKFRWQSKMAKEQKIAEVAQ
jgi:hypothetical protein